MSCQGLNANHLDLVNPPGSYPVLGDIDTTR